MSTTTLYDSLIRLLIRKAPETGVRVKLEEFRNWLKVKVDFNPPVEIVHTVRGGLIVDRNIASLMYLKELLWSCESATDKECKCGYITCLKAPPVRTKKQRKSIAYVPQPLMTRVGLSWTST